MNSRNEPSSSSRWRVTSPRPRCQVVITVNTVTPIGSGNQAPCTSLVRFAARNNRSISSSTPAPRATSHSGARQCRHMT
jgi:hypothetical protein